MPGPFQTVVGATVPVTVKLSGPPPATGATFKVTSNPIDLCKVDGSLDGTFTITRQEYDENKLQDGSSFHSVPLVFPKKTLPTEPTLPPLAPGAPPRPVLPPWNHVKISASKTDDGAPAGATVSATEGQFQVTVAGVSLSFPTEDWWIKPKGWAAQKTGNTDPADDWTPEMSEALLNLAPFAKGDEVEVRVLRSGVYAHNPPQNLPPGSPPPQPDPARDLPAGKLCTIASWAFGATVIAGQTPKPNAPPTATTHKPRSFPVVWQEGQALSDPVLITLDPPPNIVELVRAELLKAQPQQQPVPLLGRTAPGAQKVDKNPPAPVTITPLARNAEGTPSKLAGRTFTTTPGTTTVVHEWGAAAPGHARDLRVVQAREIGFEETFANRDHEHTILDTLKLPLVSSALCTAPVKGTVHGLLLEENGGYAVDWTMPRGALSTTCEVTLRHPTKLTHDYPPEEDSSPQPTTPPNPDDEPLEVLQLDVVDDPACPAKVVDPDELQAPQPGKRQRKVKKARMAPELELSVRLPKVSFDDPCFKDPPPGTKRHSWLLERLSKKRRIRGVFGVGDRATLVLRLDRPAPKGGAMVYVCSTAFEPTGAALRFPVTFPEGAVKKEEEVLFVWGSAKPQRIDIGGAPRTGHTDGLKTLWIAVAPEPAVYFPTREDDWTDWDEDDLGLGNLFHERPDWIEPPGPYARGDEVTIRARLTQPAPAGGAKADLVCDAFDRKYAVDFAEGAMDGEVTVTLAKKTQVPLSTLRLVGVTGCVGGWRAKRELEVFPERAVYFPPRACIAPTGPFIKDDHCTLSLMVHPPAPRGGCEVSLRGPFAEETVEFAEGDVFRAVTVQLTREADQPQQVALVPRRKCDRGRFAEFDIVVKTPEVGFAPGVLSPEPVARVGEDTTVMLALSHPAPAKRPLKPDELEAMRRRKVSGEDDEEDEGDVTVTPVTGEPPDESAYGAAITVRCAAFDPPEVRARAVPGATRVAVPVKVKADESLAGDVEVEVLSTPAPYRCAPSSGAKATIKVEASPWVAFADPPFRPGLGVKSSGRDEDLVFLAGQTAVLRLTAERAPVGKDLRVAVRSAAFGGKVYTATIPGVPEQKKGRTGPSTSVVTPVEVTVTLAKGFRDGGGGRPEKKVLIELVPPRGYRPATGDDGAATLELSVLAPTPSETCPLKRPEDGGTDNVLDDPHRKPCNLRKILIAEFHGELPEAPDPTAPIDPLAPPPPTPKVGTRETELVVLKGTTNLVDAKRGPWEVVRDLSLADDPKTALLYKPGEPPVIDVIAGKVPNPLRSHGTVADPKFHRTHISVQLPRGEFCTYVFEEQRKAPVAPTTPGQAPLDLLQQGQQLSTLETLVRHHPIVDVLRRGSGGPKGPQLPGKKKGKLLAFVHPPIQDVRANAASEDDPIAPPFEPPQPGSAPKVKKALPGEDATTQKGYSTLCTFTVEPKRTMIEKVTRVRVPPALTDPFSTAFGPVSTRLRAVGLDPLGDVVDGVGQGGSSLVGGVNDVLPFLQQSEDGRNQLDPTKLWSPSTGQLAGLTPMQILKMLSFALMKPNLYTLSVKTCGHPDPEADPPAPSCEELEVLIRVFPSDEFNLTYKFKPLPQTVKIGVDGEYVKGEYGEQRFSNVGMKDETSTYQQHIDQRNEKVQQSEDEYTRLEGQKLTERQDEINNQDRVDDFSSTDQAILDQAEKDSHQARALDRDVEYRTEITLPPREELEGRWGQVGKLEKTGSDQQDQREDLEVGDFLSAKYRKVLSQGEPRRAPEGGWHGGVPPGAAPGWTPRKESGEQHQVKSKVFSPVGYGPTMLGPLPPEDCPQTYRDSLDVAQQVTQNRLNEHVEWQQMNLENAGQDLQSDVTTGQSGVARTQGLIGGGDYLGAMTTETGQNPGSPSTVLMVTQNGGTNAALEKVADGIRGVFDTIGNLLEIFNRLGRDGVPSFGWGVRFEVGFLEGAVTAYWGYKEAYNADFDRPEDLPLARQAFRWYSVHLDLVLVSLRFMLDAGFRFVAAFIHFEFVIYLKIALDASVKAGFERTRPDTLKPSFVDTWFLNSAKAELGVKVVLLNEHILAANAALKTGLDFKWRLMLPDIADLKPQKGAPERKKDRAIERFGIEYEFHFIGLSLHLTVTVLGFGTRPKIWKLVEGNPPELPIKRGMFPGAANRTFNNLRQMIKQAWNKLLYQRKRLVRRLDRWQELQLDMVSTARRQRNEDGSPKWPKTRVPPGYAYAGDKDDEESKAWWKQNLAEWEEQWEACKAMFGQEAFKVRKRPGQLRVSVTKVNLAERLTSLVAKVEDIIETKVRPMLADLDERTALIKKLDDQATEQENEADEAGRPTDDLLRAVKKLDREDPVLNWRQTIRDKPLDQLDKAFLSLAYYHPQREAW